MASRTFRFLGLALVLAGCGSKKRDEPASAPPTTPPTPLAAAALDAAEALGTVEIDAAVAAAPPRAGGPCPVAHAATTGECADGTSCVLLVEIDAACTFRVAKELPFSDEIIGDDPSVGVRDLAWPRRDGPLYLVIDGSPSWRWGKVDAPLAAPADALAKVSWKSQKLGEIEPEGFQYGVESDGKTAYLVGCASWSDCGPDAEECEEWSCEKHLFLDVATGKKAARAPVHPFATPFKGGKVTDAVTMVKRGKDASTCTAAGKEPIEDYARIPDAIVPLSATDWLAIDYQWGSRMFARWSASATYGSGCARENDDPYRRIRVGPSKLWAVYEEAGWALQHGPKGAPLVGSTGAVHVGGEGPFVWTAE
jgi:hypothetical protein